MITKIQHSIKLMLLLIFAAFAGIINAQNNTSINNIKLKHAHWGQYGELGITANFEINNPHLTTDQTDFSKKKFTYNININGDSGFGSCQYNGESNNKYSTYNIEIPKHLIKANTTIGLKMSSPNKPYMLLSDADKAKSSLPKNVSSEFSIRFINNNGLMEVAGVENSNPLSVSVFEDTPSFTKSGTIDIEINRATQKPYDAVVADGVSSIRIKVNDITGVQMKYESPVGLGSLKLKGGILAKNEPNIDQYIDLDGGSATFFYHPPQYINDAFNDKIMVGQNQLNCIKVPIKLSYKDINNVTQTETIYIKVLRPLVVLVHGFTGDKTTWAGLAKYLKENNFNSISENYYELNDNWGILKSQDVFAQSRKLSQDIDKAKNTYASAGIKMLKVDIVTHSMGGLIGRYYVNGYEAYNKDVRKLFMVGTPNHGVGDLKQLLGGIGATASLSHFGMLRDVNDSSPFITNLNRNERTGGHLNPDVEYYNIYGTVDDGVTSESSAYMPGVLYKRIRNCCHSPSPDFITYLGTPLTVHETVYETVTEYLQKEIIRLPLKNAKAYIIQAKEEVLVDKGSGYSIVQQVPFEVNTYDKIISKENSSLTIAFTIDGQEFGRLITGQNTSLQLKNFCPQVMTVRVVKGKARFNSNGAGADGKHFQVEIQPDNYNKYEWYNFSPKVDLNALGTTFDLIYENGITNINLIEGTIRLDNNVQGSYKTLSTPQTAIVANDGSISTKTLEKDAELQKREAESPAEMKPNPLFANVTSGGNLVNSGQIKVIASADNSQNCLNSLTPQFLQKVGPVNNQQAQNIAKKIDDDNKREVFLFNQAKNNFNNGILPREMKGTYRYQENPGIFSQSYSCPTITLFAPMKITGVNGTTSGFKILREGKEYKEFNANSDAIGEVLPCGSYRAYPNEDRQGSTVSLNLEKVE